MEAITAEPTSQLEHRERQEIADRVPGLRKRSVVKGAIPPLPHPFSAPARVRPALERFALAAFALLTLSACDFYPTGSGTPPAAPPGLAEALNNPGTFAWIPLEGMTCRDGSSTGIGLRLQRPRGQERSEDHGHGGRRGGISDKLVIFLEGGGACFNQPTCQQNRASFTREDFFSEAFVGGYSGLFEEERPDNPVADWNFVYVPFCTGDEHAGSNAHGVVPGVDADGDGQDDRQRFVGYDNVGEVLEFIATHLGTGFERVLLAGSSAGGVGSLANFDRVARTFPQSEPALLDDSGPVFYDDAMLPVALQQVWIDLWNLDETLPAGPLSEGTDVLANIYTYLAQTYPEAPLGLLSYEQDFTIRFFYSFGIALEDPACFRELYGGLTQDPPERRSCISGPAYEEALYDLRAELPAPWRTFYVGETDQAQQQHTFLRSERFYSATAGGQSLSGWIEELLEGSAEDRGTQEESAELKAAVVDALR